MEDEMSRYGIAHHRSMLAEERNGVDLSLREEGRYGELLHNFIQANGGIDHHEASRDQAIYEASRDQAIQAILDARAELVNRGVRIFKSELSG